MCITFLKLSYQRKNMKIMFKNYIFFCLKNFYSNRFEIIFM